MTKKQYAAYLCSEHWRELRKDLLEIQPECERCRLPRWLAELVYDQDLHVHHKTYVNLGHEQPEDLEVLCRRCHDIETFGRSELSQIKSIHCALCGSPHWDRRAELCGTCFAIFQTPYLFHISDHVRPGDDEPVFEYILKMLLFVPYLDSIGARVSAFKAAITKESRRLKRSLSATVEDIFNEGSAE